MWLTSRTPLPCFSILGQKYYSRWTKRRKIGGHHYSALLFEPEREWGKRFSFETWEIKSSSLPMPSRDSAEMIRFMCHSIICSLKAFSLTMQLYRMDVNVNVGGCDVGLATGGALYLVSLIAHTCLGNVCVFIQQMRVIFFMEKKKKNEGTACNKSDASLFHLFS